MYMVKQAQKLFSRTFRPGKKNWKKMFKKILEKTLKKMYRQVMLPLQLGRKTISIFVCFGCATPNKALGMTKWVSKYFLFHQRIYGVNFKRIDNGPNFTTISTIAARERDGSKRTIEFGPQWSDTSVIKVWCTLTHWICEWRIS